jgi:hypothetical protein
LLKAIIGRARESRAVAEMELMSSTSHDVCEVWNGRQIVRVMGPSPMRQILYFPSVNSNPEGTENSTTSKSPVSDSCGLFSLEEAVKAGLLKEDQGKQYSRGSISHSKCSWMMMM